MTFKPRKRFAHAALAAAATLTLALAACETPTPPQSVDNSASEPTFSTANAGATDSAAAFVRPIIRINAENGAGEPEPLIVVDGVMVDPASGFELGDLDPDAIESIEVIKGGAAEALYGERAAGGVIKIYTKIFVSVREVDSTGN